MRRKLWKIGVTFVFLLSQMTPLCIKALDVPTSDIEEQTQVQAKSNPQSIGNLEIDIKFVLPIYNTLTTNFNIELTGIEGSKMVIPLNDIQEPIRKAHSFGNDSVDVLVRKLDKKGLDLQGVDQENTIVYIGTTVYGLKQGNYQITLTGEGYHTYTTSVTLDSYSKRVTLSNETGLLEAGDVNQDGQVNETDIDLMLQMIGKYDANYDLNRDEKVDIADLNYITASLSQEKKGVVVIDTSAILSLNDVTVSGNITGDISALFEEAGSIQVAPSNTGDVSKTNPAIVNLDFKQSVEASEIRLETGIENVPTNMLFTIITEDDEIIEMEKSFSINEDIHKFTDKPNENTIVIKLGKQVAVKRVIITITETSSNKLADIAKVDFLNNVYETVPIVTVERPTNVEATVGSEQATVTFDHMRNVTGYEILVEQLNESGTVVKSVVYQTTYNKFKVTGLKNYTNYRIRVQSVNQEWKSGYCSIEDAIIIQPVPSRKPPKVNMVVVKPVYAGFNISWKKMDDTLSYNIYYRKKGTEEFTVISNITTNSYSLRNLEPEQEYEIAVTGTNTLGEGPMSDMAVGTTMGYVMPILTKYNLINRPSDHIKSVSLVKGNQTDGTFSMFDDNYETYFKADTWDIGGYNVTKAGPTIAFDAFYEMDYILLVPNIDSSFSYTKVYYWNEEGKQVQASTYIQSLTSENGQKYYKIGFNQPIKTNKIQVCVANYLAKGNITIREMKFYAHDTLLDEVASLFKDELRVELVEDVTLEKIEMIEQRVNTIDPISGEYSPNKSILLSDLAYAKKILNDKNIQDVITIDTGISNANDTKLGFAMQINDFQPLGVVARPGEKLAIYVGNTGNVEPELIFTQYYAEANVWSVTYSRKLKKGQNIIDVPLIGSGADERGGSIYIRYPNTTSNAIIKVRVSGGTKIPVLDLHKQTDESVKRNLIANYLSEIKTYVGKLPTIYASNNMKYNKKISVLNSTEIVTDEGLLSIPASVVVDTYASLLEEEQINRLLESTAAFDEMVNLFYRHKGLSDSATDAINRTPTSRINIRYMRMFDGAFMYAGGKHIGVGFESTAGLLTGKTYNNTNFSRYFGWGISHEIGHQINQGKLVYAEVTNNIYSLLAQTANDTSSSRLESSNIYPKIYEKVTSGTQGKASNVFVSLGMYWQLHLAYDDTLTYTDTNSIFARINQYSRSSTLTGSKDDLLVMYASDAAGENLISFFEKWGYKIGENAKKYVNEKYTNVSKPIWYLNDAARRYRLNGGTNILDTTQVVASIVEADSQKKRVTLNFNVTEETDKILGYEIKRNGEVIMFTTSNTFTDVIGALNNRAVTYEVTAYDKLLKATNTVTLEELKIAHDGSLGKSNFTIESNTGESINFEDETLENMPTLPVQQLIDGNTNTIYNGTTKDAEEAYLLIHLNRKYALSGIKYQAAVENGNLLQNTIQDYAIYVSEDNENWILAKKGIFNVSAENPTQTVYFDKEGTTGENQLWTYNNIAYVKIVAIGKNGISGAEIDFIAPPGDNVEMSSTTIGRLKEDYCYQVDAIDEEGNKTSKEECLKAGMVVFKGQYRGDPAFNIVLVADANNELTRYSGISLFFANLNSEGNVYEVADGTWIYAVTEAEYEKLIGKNVRAYLYRVDDALSLDGQRLTSTSRMVTLPGYLQLPNLSIEAE